MEKRIERKLEFWELKEGQYVTLKFKVEGKDNDFSIIICKVKEIHYDNIYLERTLIKEDKPIKAVIFASGCGMRSGEDIIRPYEVFEASEGDYLSELI